MYPPEAFLESLLYIDWSQF